MRMSYALQMIGEGNCRHFAKYNQVIENTTRNGCEVHFDQLSVCTGEMAVQSDMVDCISSHRQVTDEKGNQIFCLQEVNVP